MFSDFVAEAQASRRDGDDVRQAAVPTLTRVEASQRAASPTPTHALIVKGRCLHIAERAGGAAPDLTPLLGRVQLEISKPL
jgi:hypothetical protein